MQNGLVFLGVLCLAIIVTAVSFLGYGENCANVIELPERGKSLAGDLSTLLGSVSSAINVAKQPETNVAISTWWEFHLPQKAVVVKAWLFATGTVLYLEQNVRDTLYRVGDLVFSLIEDKKLIIRVVNSIGLDTPHYFMLDKNVLEDFSSCQYRTRTDKEQWAFVDLGVFAIRLRGALPGSATAFRYYFIPQIGGYVMLNFDSVATRWTCEDWKTHLEAAMDTISDDLFDRRRFNSQVQPSRVSKF